MAFLNSVFQRADTFIQRIGEGVAPGFDFRDFKFVTREELEKLTPEAFAKHADLIKPDPEDTFDQYYEGR